MLFKRRQDPRRNDNPKADAAKGPWPKRFFREWIVPLAIVGAILAPIRSSIADWNDVPSGSMRPTILEGDRIYINKLAYGLRVPFTTTWITHWDTPGRGDIVTFKSPENGIRLVKRVIGLPGDRIAMHGNQLIINGEPAGYTIIERDVPMRMEDGRMVLITVQEEQLSGSDSSPSEGIVRDDTIYRHALTITPQIDSVNSFPEKVVPDGQYFVMGDNRDMSRDSRMIGFVPLDSIYGKSSHVALSLDPENSYLPRLSRWFSRLR